MNPRLVSRQDGRSTNGRRRTSIYKATFERVVGYEQPHDLPRTETRDVVLQVVTETDSYAPQCHTAVKTLEADNWSSERLVWRQGKEMASYVLESDLTAGRLSETIRAMRERGVERPFETLLEEAINVDESAALADAVAILAAAHGPLA